MKKYRFKILKVLISLGFSLLFLLSFLINCCASSNFEFSFREIMDAGGLSSTVFTSSGSELSITPTWNWANHLVTSVPTGTMSYRLETYSNNSDLFYVYGADNVLLLKINRFSIACNGFPNQNTVEYSLRFGFRFLLDDGTFQYVYSPLISATSAGTDEPSWNRPYAYFDNIDLNINVPVGATRLYSIILDFRYPESIGSFIVGTWSGNLSFYVGNRTTAPIYDVPSVPGQSEFEESEADLMDKASSGLNQTKTLIGSVKGFLETANSFTDGARILSISVNSFLIRFPIFNAIITISLALGLLTFVIGAIGVFIRRR